MIVSMIVGIARGKSYARTLIGLMIHSFVIPPLASGLIAFLRDKRFQLSFDEADRVGEDMAASPAFRRKMHGFVKHLMGFLAGTFGLPCLLVLTLPLLWCTEMLYDARVFSEQQLFIFSVTV